MPTKVSTEPLLPDALTASVRRERYSLGALTVCLYKLPKPPPSPPAVKHLRIVPPEQVLRVHRYLAAGLAADQHVFTFPELLAACHLTFSEFRLALRNASLRRLMDRRGLVLFGLGDGRPVGMLRRREAQMVATAILNAVADRAAS